MASGKEFDYKKAQLETWDFVVLAVYFVIVLIVGIMVSALKVTNSSKEMLPTETRSSSANRR